MSWGEEFIGDCGGVVKGLVEIEVRWWMEWFGVVRGKEGVR